MLFPNLEREEITSDPTTGGVPDSALTTVELRRENIFSTAFKELILDDAVLTMQAFEDQVMKNSSVEKVTLGELLGIVNQMFTIEATAKEIGAQLRKVIQDYLGSSTTSYEVSVNRMVALQQIRTKCVFRSRVFREHNFSLSSVAKKLMTRLYKGDAAAAAAVADAVKQVDYREVLQSTHTRRRSYLDDDGVSDHVTSRLLAGAEGAAEAADHA